jgi:hypothetical protein
MVIYANRYEQGRTHLCDTKGVISVVLRTYGVITIQGRGANK